MEDAPCTYFTEQFNIIKKDINYLDILFTLELSLDSKNNLKIICESETGIIYEGEIQFKDTRREFLIKALNKEDNISLFGDPNKDDLKALLGGGFIEVSLKENLSNKNFKNIVHNLNKKCIELIKQVKILKEETKELKKELNEEKIAKNKISQDFVKTYIEKINQLIKNQEELFKFFQKEKEEKEKNKDVLIRNVKLPDDWNNYRNINYPDKIIKKGNEIILNELTNSYNLINNLISN